MLRFAVFFGACCVSAAIGLGAGLRLAGTAPAPIEPHPITVTAPVAAPAAALSPSQQLPELEVSSLQDIECAEGRSRQRHPFLRALRELDEQFDKHIQDEDYRSALAIASQDHPAFQNLDERRQRRLERWRLSKLHDLSFDFEEARSELLRHHGDARSAFQLYGEREAFDRAYASLPRWNSDRERVELFRMAVEVNPSAVGQFLASDAAIVLNSSTPELALSLIADHRTIGQDFLERQRHYQLLLPQEQLSDTHRDRIKAEQEAELENLRLLAELYEGAGNGQAASDLRYDLSRIEDLGRRPPL